jgi:hypothetical protein
LVAWYQRLGNRRASAALTCQHPRVTSREGKGLGSLSLWHSLILLIILAVIVGAVVGFVVLIVRLARPKSVNPQGVPGAPTASAPGWYPDPNDSRILSVISMGECGLHRPSLGAECEPADERPNALS